MILPSIFIEMKSYYMYMYVQENNSDKYAIYCKISIYTALLICQDAVLLKKVVCHIVHALYLSVNEMRIYDYMSIFIP